MTSLIDYRHLGLNILQLKMLRELHTLYTQLDTLDDPLLEKYTTMLGSDRTELYGTVYKVASTARVRFDIDPWDLRNNDFGEHFFLNSKKNVSLKREAIVVFAYNKGLITVPSLNGS